MGGVIVPPDGVRPRDPGYRGGCDNKGGVVGGVACLSVAGEVVRASVAGGVLALRLRVSGAGFHLSISAENISSGPPVL